MNQNFFQLDNGSGVDIGMNMLPSDDDSNGKENVALG